MDARTDDRGKYFTPRVNKESVAAVIRTVDHLIIGQIYVRADQRLKDGLNNSQEHFIAITDATVYNSSGSELLFESSFLFVTQAHVIFVSPLDAIKAEGAPAWLEHHKEEEQ